MLDNRIRRLSWICSGLLACGLILLLLWIRNMTANSTHSETQGETTFWKIIEETRDDDEDLHVRRIEEALTGAGPEAVLSFERAFRACKSRLYRADVWNIAYIILGGCGNDSFECVRAWIILRGRDFVEQVLANPVALAAEYDKRPTSMECAELLSLARRVYEKSTGEHLSIPPRQPTLQGTLIVNEAEMKAAYPTLWSKYRESGKK